ncbi:hypothetical protein LAZ67_1001331 [Cordylochernes scorpioides]|uniref:RNA-directed DNA polymerase n=1 Tax=Cordylochernes scorpioides TaxID=51811 RepID=A0ABY6JXY7_9ARAC|nr:hypothetical protein LAZ67_1001331 [Cordylochernes scorpioides]
MLQYGIIAPSVSPYASPITLVTKRDQTKRFCIDYRKLNEIIAPDVHPLPLIETILDKLSKAKYYSSVDIASAYWQVEIEPNSRNLLAFVTLDSQYEFCRLPYGFKNSPQIYHRAINQVMQKYKLNFVTHYFDDFIIFSDTLEDHLQHLQQFLTVCQHENIKLNYNKCSFFKTNIDFLGYTVTAGTYAPQTRNLDTINAIKPPTNRKTLQSFLGAVNVYNKFIADYARLRAPLNKLLIKDVKWNWNPDCQQAFTTLKESLTSKPVLHLYQVGLPCRLYCDASTQGIAGILKQVHPDGQIHPVQYFSRALRAHERNYTVSELECLAIVESVDKFRIYLTGIKFTIYTDHQALQWLKTIKNPSGRLFRWSLRLSTYNYEIHYIKGSQQYEADLLSRNPFVGFISTDIIKQHQPTASPFNIDTNGLHTITRKGVTKIIIPETLQHTLMNKVHQEYNHPGISQMTRIITTQYYWKGISKSIEKFVRSCHTCQIIKRPKGKPYGALGQIPPPQQPFDLISIDTIAGFSKYGHSKTYLHVIVDHLTRYAWTFPSKSTSTLTYIQTLKTVLQQGSPKRLLSDRAPAFTSEKFRKFLIMHGIQPLLTTSNNPQANGLIERLNATITGKLRLAYLENPKASWTQLVKRVTQTYNNTPHSVTSFPPTYLMFNVIPPDLRTHLNPYPEINIAREIASSRTQNKHKKDKETFDKQHRTPHFEENDLVLVKNYRHPDTGKLAPYFTGPYKIIEIISPNVVRIDRPNQPLNRDSDTIHVNKLKYYTEDVLYITPPQPRFVQHPQRLPQDCSDGWLWRFQRRNTIASLVVSGEINKVSEETVIDWLTRFEEIKNEYKDEDIFNIDETGVFYNLLPDRSLDFKGTKCHGTSKSKERLTVVLCCNATGSEISKLWIIGKLWLIKFQRKMSAENRHVLLTMDNCSAHDTKDLDLPNVRIVYFPANCTSRIQPLDQGIIAAFKCHFKSRLVKNALLGIESEQTTVKWNILQAMRAMAASWDSVFSQTIKICFKKAWPTVEGKTADSFSLPETMLDEPEEWTKLLSATNPAETLTFLEKEEEETEDDEVKEEIMMPTRGEVIAALETLQKLSKTSADIDVHFEDDLDKIRRECLKQCPIKYHQKTITDFLKPAEKTQI